MDDKTLQTLTALANKLGTTAEYLWSVLLKQAPITGVTDLLLLIALVLGTAIWARTVYVNTSEEEWEKRWQDDTAPIAWISVAVLFVITLILVTSNLSMVFAALFNPEYWALKQVLK